MSAFEFPYNTGSEAERRAQIARGAMLSATFTPDGARLLTWQISNSLMELDSERPIDPFVRAHLGSVVGRVFDTIDDEGDKQGRLLFGAALYVAKKSLHDEHGDPTLGGPVTAESVNVNEAIMLFEGVAAQTHAKLFPS
ncbi:MAG TPA: hypothetical protein VLH38_01320 [Patescibacteria group bacterium]|nr:hypothetical protein [Patescibacteria group bacterium]